MHWVVQDNMFNEEGFKSLIEVLERLKMPHSVHKVLPFSEDLDEPLEPPANIDEHQQVIVMGSYTMAKIAAKRGWYPGAFVGPNLSYDVQLAFWGDRMLNADMKVHPFGEVPFQSKPFFCRPLVDSKAFTGQVMDWGQYQEFRDHITALTPEERRHQLGLGTPVMICSVKEVYRECRVFMVGGKAVTACYYKTGTRKHYDPVVEQEITDFAEKLDAEWRPLLAYVLDVARTPTGLKVVEVNCFNAAGWYKCDLGKLVNAIEEAYQQRGNET